jgi:hypothetical protein
MPEFHQSVLFHWQNSAAETQGIEVWAINISAIKNTNYYESASKTFLRFNYLSIT